MQSCLITGACGFIGSNVLNYMFDTFKETRFICVDKMDYCSKVENIRSDIRTSNRFSFQKLDINETNAMYILFVTNKVDTIIHFAAQTHVDNSFGNSIQFTKDNVLGTHSLLEAMRLYGKIKKFIHISTDEIYGEVDLEHKGCSEKTLLNPTNPYAATKAGAEFLVRSYGHSFNLPYIIIRMNNVYGPNQYPEKLIPKFIMFLKNNKKCTVHGKGDTRRNFIYTDDVSRALIIILEKGQNHEIYNIGTKNEYSVMDILKKLVQQMKPNEDWKDWVEYVEDRNFNDFRYCIDYTSLTNLGWKEEVKFEEGFRKTIESMM